MEDFLSGLDDGLPDGGLEEAEKSAPAPVDARFRSPLLSRPTQNTLNTPRRISLSTRGDAGVSGRDGPVTIDADWVPGAADMAFAQVRRPDLTPADVALIGAKFALHYAGQALANPTAVFHRWILTERVAHHDHRDISRNHRCPIPAHGQFQGQFRSINGDRQPDERPACRPCPAKQRSGG